jgi:magnesium-transporting ATPase (P-type)
MNRCSWARPLSQPRSRPPEHHQYGQGGDDLPYVYSGSLVVRGHGRAEVTATGPRSEIGKIGLAITRMDTEPPRPRVHFGAIEPLAFYKPCSRTGAALYVIIGAMPCRFLHGL